MVSFSCVYGIYVGGRLIYIGRTSDLIKRVKRHLSLAYNQNRQNDGNLYTVLHACISNGVIPRFKVLSVNDYEEFRFILRNRDKLVCNINVGKVSRKKMPPCEFVRIPYKLKRRITNSVLSGIYVQIENLNAIRQTI